MNLLNTNGTLYDIMLAVYATPSCDTEPILVKCDLVLNYGNLEGTHKIYTDDDAAIKNKAYIMFDTKWHVISDVESWSFGKTALITEMKDGKEEKHNTL